MIKDFINFNQIRPYPFLDFWETNKYRCILKKWRLQYRYDFFTRSLFSATSISFKRTSKIENFFRLHSLGKKVHFPYFYWSTHLAKVPHLSHREGQCMLPSDVWASRMGCSVSGVLTRVVFLVGGRGRRRRRQLLLQRVHAVQHAAVQAAVTKTVPAHTLQSSPLTAPGASRLGLSCAHNFELHIYVVRF